MVRLSCLYIIKGHNVIMLYKCKNYAQLVKFGESTSRFEEILKQKQRDLKSAL